LIIELRITNKVQILASHLPLAEANAPSPTIF
jgi:hypothetical protein